MICGLEVSWRVRMGVVLYVGDTLGMGRGYFGWLN